MSNSISQYQRQWFKKIRPFLLGTNLHVGSGLGYFSLFAEEAGIHMVSLEVDRHPGAVDLRDFVLYDGKRIPFDDNCFETSIAIYVLHHTPDRRLVLGEMRRVTSRRIILVEELYHGFFGKVRLMLLDFWVNFKAGQGSHIHWKSYFDSDRFCHDVEGEGWRITHMEKTPKGGYEEVLCVLERV